MRKILSNQIQSFDIVAKEIRISLRNKTVITLNADKCRFNWVQWTLENLEMTLNPKEQTCIALHECVSKKMTIRFLDDENTTLIFPNDIRFLGFTIFNRSQAYLEIHSKIQQSAFTAYDLT